MPPLGVGSRNAVGLGEFEFPFPGSLTSTFLGRKTLQPEQYTLNKKKLYSLNNIL